ncbi:MAG: putative PEP-binding protein [Spirochaetaceae bacterium]
MNKILPFSSHVTVTDEETRDLMGSRGRRAMELSELDLPICPGFIVPNEALQHFPDEPEAGWQRLKDPIDKIESIMSKHYSDSASPLLLKVVESPILNVQSQLPSVHHVGLCDSTIDGFSEAVGETFAWQEYGWLVRSILRLQAAQGLEKEEEAKVTTFREQLRSARKKTTISKAFKDNAGVIPEEFFSDSRFQISYILRLFRGAYAQSPTTEDSAVMVQAMVYGNLDEKSSAGYFFTHNIITGENELYGEHFPQAFDENAKKGKPIDKLEEPYLSQLKETSKKLEHHFREIRRVRFTIERGDLWIVDQATVPNKSTQAEIKTYLDLYREKVIDDAYVINAIKPGRLAEILHPTLDVTSVKSATAIKGGIAGAVGAAIGRVFFSTDRLIQAHREAQQKGEDTDVILAMPATFADDVKGIEVAQGVIASEGGYASHAPVVARSLGKVALVYQEIKFNKTSMVIDGKTVKEGDYITLNVPYYEDPTIYLAKGNLTKPTPEGSGLLELLELIQNHIDEFDVHANADQPRDAKLSRTFGAHGIGLCRTEHMFFAEERINRFRYMILADTDEERNAALEGLRKDQTKDFYELLKIMGGYPVTIRLLDAPLHEFLPTTREGMAEFVKVAVKENKSLTAAKIRARSQMLREFNPMLGHRGVRIAISYPEIYRMQVRAIFEAAYTLKKEGIDVKPEIMVPLVMTASEIKVVRNGKRIEGKQILGIRDIEEEVRGSFNTEPLEYKVGTMVELPAAALQADEIARYADFFSFGTNDLTQTTTGISRDDFNTFFSDYNLFDLLPSNPFKVLEPQVREMIEIASTRGRMTRPDLTLGICGEHGAEPQNIAFFRAVGLDYVSVSPYGIPIAKLAIAQMNLEHKQKLQG